MTAQDKHLDKSAKRDGGDAHAHQLHEEVQHTNKENESKQNLGDPGLQIDKQHGTVDYSDSRWNHSVKAHVTNDGVSANVDGWAAKFEKATGEADVRSGDLNVHSEHGRYEVTDKRTGETLHWDNKHNSGYICDKEGHKVAEFHSNNDLSVWLKNNESVNMVNGNGDSAGSAADREHGHHKHGDQNLFSDKQGDVAAVTGSGAEIKANKDGSVDVTEADGTHLKFKMHDGHLEPVNGSDMDRLNREIKWDEHEHRFDLGDTHIEMKDGKWQIVARDQQGRDVNVVSDGSQHTDTLSGGMFGTISNLPNCSFIDSGSGDPFMGGMHLEGEHHHMRFGRLIDFGSYGMVMTDGRITAVISDSGGLSMFDQHKHRLFCANEHMIDICGDLKIDAAGTISDSKTGKSTSSSAYSSEKSTSSSNSTTAEAPEALKEAKTAVQTVLADANAAPISAGDSAVLLGHYSQLSDLAAEAIDNGNQGLAATLYGEQTTVGNAIDRVNLQVNVQSQLAGMPMDTINQVMNSSDPISEARRISNERRFGTFGDAGNAA